MSGNKEVSCLKDGEAEEETDTPDSLQLEKKMKMTLDLLIGEKVVAGQTEEDIDNPDSLQLGDEEAT